MNNNFETAYAARAADFGMTEDQFYAWEAALSDEEAEMAEIGYPNFEIEDRPVVSERDVFDPVTVFTVDAIDAMERDFMTKISQARLGF